MVAESLSFVVSNAIVARACVDPSCTSQTRRKFRRWILHGYCGSETRFVFRTFYSLEMESCTAIPRFPELSPASPRSKILSVSRFPFVSTLPQNLFLKAPVLIPLPLPVVPWSHRVRGRWEAGIPSTGNIVFRPPQKGQIVSMYEIFARMR